MGAKIKRSFRRSFQKGKRRLKKAIEKKRDIFLDKKSVFLFGGILHTTLFIFAYALKEIMPIFVLIVSIYILFMALFILNDYREEYERDFINRLGSMDKKGIEGLKLCVNVVEIREGKILYLVLDEGFNYKALVFLNNTWHASYNPLFLRDLNKLREMPQSFIPGNITYAFKEVLESNIQSHVEKQKRLKKYASMISSNKMQ